MLTMKNIKLSIAAILTIFLGFSSCIEHEVIPAPVPEVDLFCEFSGSINSTAVQLTQNVSGYYLKTSKAKILLPPPSLSSAVYYSEILSASSNASIKVSLGSLNWDASTLNEPSIAAFNDFHANALSPVYTTGAASGFEVTYRDGLGNVWVSQQGSPNPQVVLFSNIKQESDATGDYSKFQCNFSCYVYRQEPITLVWDSLPIQNAIFKGWFKR